LVQLIKRHGLMLTFPQIFTPSGIFRPLDNTI
jgi:hypothetical protein